MCNTDLHQSTTVYIHLSYNRLGPGRPTDTICSQCLGRIWKTISVIPTASETAHQCKIWLFTLLFLKGDEGL